jgi:hypothetical protein
MNGRFAPEPVICYLIRPSARRPLRRSAHARRTLGRLTPGFVRNKRQALICNGSFALSRNSTVANHKSVSPTFSRSWILYSPVPYTK